MKNDDLSEIPICEIYDLYEILEDELKYQVLKRLPEKYKVKMDNDLVFGVETLLKSLQRVSNDESPTLEELESAVMKFISRTLQNGIFDPEKSLMQFVTARADFWSKDYDDSKKDFLTYDQSIIAIQIANVMNLI